MKIFPLRADFGGFFLPPCRLKWHQKCPQGFVKRVNTKCRKSRIPDRFGWAGRWEAKPPWRYSPGAAKFSQIKSNIPVLSPPSQELLPSFPPFHLSKLLQTFRTFPYFHRHRFIFSWMSKNPMSWSKRRRWMYLLLPASWFSLKTHFNKCIATPQVSLPASFPAPQSLLTLLKNSPAGSHLRDAILRDRFLLFPPTPVLKVEFLA